MRCAAPSGFVVPAAARSPRELRRRGTKARCPGPGPSRVPTRSCDRDPRGFFDRALSLRARRPSELHVRPGGATSRDRSRFVIFRRRKHPERPERSPLPIGNVRTGRVGEWIGGPSMSAQGSEQGPGGLAGFLLLVVLGFQALLAFGWRELSEHGVLHR